MVVALAMKRHATEEMREMPIEVMHDAGNFAFSPLELMQKEMVAASKSESTLNVDHSNNCYFHGRATVASSGMSSGRSNLQHRERGFLDRAPVALSYDERSVAALNSSRSVAGIET